MSASSTSATASGRGRLLHRREWLGLGVHSRRLASPEFLRITAGYFTPASNPATLTEICRVLQREAFPRCPATHTTAALLHRLPLPAAVDDGVGMLAAGAYLDEDGRREIPCRLSRDAITDPFAGVEGPDIALPTVHLARPRGAAGASGYVQVHRLVPGAVVRRSGVLVDDPISTLRQLGEILPLWDLVAAVDAAIGPGGCLEGTCPDQILAAATSPSFHRRPGSPMLRTAATLAREHVESVGETHLRLLVKGAGFPEPVPNLEQRVTSTGRIRRLDGALPEWGIGLEYDGSWRRTSARQWREDEARRDDLAAEGWELRRFTYRDRLRPLESLVKLREALKRRGAPAPSVADIRLFVSSLDRDRPSLIYGHDPGRR